MIDVDTPDLCEECHPQSGSEDFEELVVETLHEALKPFSHMVLPTEAVWTAVHTGTLTAYLKDGYCTKHATMCADIALAKARKFDAERTRLVLWRERSK